MTIRATASEVAKNFGRYRDEAQREPVEITSHGRPIGYFLSVHEFNELVRLRALERKAYSLNNLPADIADAIEHATMDTRHDHLNRLMENGK